MEKDTIIKGLLEKIMGKFAGEEAEARLTRAFEMGCDYAKTRRFDNSRFYHSYQYRLDDGTRVSSTSFFNQFMNRNQTGAYMDAEAAVKEFFSDEKEILFHMVRDQRFGINGVFKAVMTPSEPQQLNYTDYVLVIAGFCAGYMNSLQ